MLLPLLLAGIIGILRVRLGGATAGCLAAVGVWVGATVELDIELVQAAVSFVLSHGDVVIGIAVTA